RALQRCLGVSIDQSANPPIISLNPPRCTTLVPGRLIQHQRPLQRHPLQVTVANALVQRQPEQALMKESLPSHLKILDTVQDLGWIALYLTYDTKKCTKCFTVEIKPGTVKPMTVIEYKRYGRLHNKMIQCPEEDKKASYEIWSNWQRDGK
ncbi:hypothetical protein FOL47_006096, partial [Perkinsus chesapeaki]